MNTTQPTEKPRPTMFRRVYGAFDAIGEWLAYLGNPPPVPKPGEFWTDDNHPINPWAKTISGARVIEVRDGWVRFERIFAFPCDEHPPSVSERHERVSTFHICFNPPAE